MQFIDNAPRYRIIRTTGPTHNMLGLEFSEDRSIAEPVVDILDAGQDVLRQLNTDDVVAAVVKGLALAYAQTGIHRQIKRIQFLASDSPPVEVYEFLAQEIVRRAGA